MSVSDRQYNYSSQNKCQVENLTKWAAHVVEPCFAIRQSAIFLVILTDCVIVIIIVIVIDISIMMNDLCGLTVQ